jgi:hypothetical protein
MAFSLNYVLPTKFMGIIPLFIGIEVILGIAILNKASGVYGFLSIVTGHPINFWQWLYNMLAIATLPFYIKALVMLKTKPNNGRTTSLACIIYIIDTIVGVFYTIYFVYFWFHDEDNISETGSTSPQAYGTEEQYQVASESASQTRELFLTLSGTIVFTVVRFYFALVMISFTRLLLKQLKYERSGQERDDEFDELVLATGPFAKVRRFIFNVECKAQEQLSDYFKS